MVSDQNWSAARPPDGGGRLVLTGEWLTERYVTRRWSAQQIADAAGWSSQYVRNALRRHSIALRVTGTHSGLRQVDKGELARWLADGDSVAAIAARTGYSPDGVRKLCRRLGVTIPPARRPGALQSADALVVELVELYQQQGLSLAAIAARYGRSSEWVTVRLRSAGVQIRRAGRRDALDADQVHQLLEAGLTVSAIAAELRRSEWTVRSVMDKHGWSGPPPAGRLLRRQCFHSCDRGVVPEELSGVNCR